jgi:hypothetical protein
MTEYRLTHRTVTLLRNGLPPSTTSASLWRVTAVEYGTLSRPITETAASSVKTVPTKGWSSPTRVDRSSAATNSNGFGKPNEDSLRARSYTRD